MACYPLFEALNPNEYRLGGNAACGEMEGYPLMMVYIKSNTLRISITTREIDAGVAKLVKGTLVGQGIKAKVQGRLVFYNLKVKGQTDPGDVLSTVRTVVSVLRCNGVAAPERCILCGQSGYDAYMLYGGCYDAVHETCVTKLQSSAQLVMEEDPGSYGRGILGALVGAIVGSIPAILGLTVLNIISAWLFMLIPMATYYGYKKAGGRMNRGATVLSIVLSVVALGVTLLCWDVAINIQWMSMNLGEAIGYTLQNMTLPGYWSWMAEDFGKIIVFFLLGIVFSLARIRRTNKTVVQDLARQRETLLRRREGWSAPTATQQSPGAECATPASVGQGKDDPWAINGLEKFK